MPWPRALQVASTANSSQTLSRAIDLLEALSDGPLDLRALQHRVGLARSTTHRLAQLLTERRLVSVERRCYRLGPQLVQLAAKGAQRRDLVARALTHIDALAAETQDAVNLAVRDGDEITYVAQAPSRRRLAVRHRVGDRNQIAKTALGRALLMDVEPAIWAQFFPHEKRSTGVGDVGKGGAFLHFEDGGDGIRCIAAPIRDVAGTIIAAISLSSTADYLDEARAGLLAPRLLAAAAAINAQLGHDGARRPRSA